MRVSVMNGVLNKRLKRYNPFYVSLTLFKSFENMIRNLITLMKPAHSVARGLIVGNGFFPTKVNLYHIIIK